MLILITRHSRYRLFVSHHRGTAAKRPERRHRRGFRRNGKPDRLWPARFGNGPVQSHNMVGDHLHGDFDYFVGDGVATRRSKISAARVDPSTEQIAAGKTGSRANNPATEITQHARPDTNISGFASEYS